MDCSCIPTVAIDRAVTKHLEVLHRVCFLGIGIRKRVNKTLAFDRILLNAIDGLRSRNTGCLEYGRSNINNVPKLRTLLTLGFNYLRPGDDHAVACTTEV